MKVASITFYFCQININAKGLRHYDEKYELVAAMNDLQWKLFYFHFFIDFFMFFL